MKARLEATIFDVDGVIVDTEQLQSDCFVKILKEIGHSQPILTQYGTVQVPGETTEQTWERLKLSHDIGLETDVLSLRKRQTVLEALEDNLEPLPGLLPLLRELTRNRDISIAAASSAKTERIRKIIHDLGIADSFDAIVSSDDVSLVKPDPEPYILAADKLGVSPETCVAIEDTEAGVTAAKTAGMKVVAVPTIYTASMNFEQADMVVSSLTFINKRKLSGLFNA